MAKSKLFVEKEMFLFEQLAYEFYVYDSSEIKCIIDAFGSHLNIDLQQRSVEFSQLFKTHGNLRSALLEKMPPMQVVRENQNAEYGEDNDSNELIGNGIDGDANSASTPSDSVSDQSRELSTKTPNEPTIFFCISS